MPPIVGHGQLDETREGRTSCAYILTSLRWVSTLSEAPILHPRGRSRAQSPAPIGVSKGPRRDHTAKPLKCGMHTL